MDLIDRQSAIDALHGYFDGMLETDTWSPCDVYGLIEILPSADAVEVVRCKDCKHRCFDNRFGFMCNLDTGDPYEMGRNAYDDDWFCADGER